MQLFSRNVLKHRTWQQGIARPNQRTHISLNEGFVTQCIEKLKSSPLPKCVSNRMWRNLIVKDLSSTTITKDNVEIKNNDKEEGEKRWLRVIKPSSNKPQSLIWGDYSDKLSYRSQLFRGMWVTWPQKSIPYSPWLRRFHHLCLLVALT